MQNIELNPPSQTFKVNQPVRVLKKNKDSWETFSFGIIIEMGDKFARIWDNKRSDTNTGLLADSCEFFPFESKMLKIIKD